MDGGELSSAVEQARAAAERAAGAAEAARAAQGGADSSGDDAQQARDEAQDAKDDARRAQDEAQRAKDDARHATHDAQDAKHAAQHARDEARTAHAGAVAARTAVEATVPPDDPLLDDEVRKIEAQVSEQAPYGVPGPPLSRRSPFWIGFTGALGVALAYLLGRAVLAAHTVLVLVLVSAFLAIGLNPAVEYFERRGLTRSRAVTIVLVVVLLVFALVGYAVVPPIVEQVQQLVSSAPDYLRQLQENRRIASLDNRFHLIQRAQTYLTDGTAATNAIGGVLGVGRVVATTLFSVVTVLTLTLYFMAGLPRIKTTAYRLVPRSRRARFGVLTDDILARVGGYVAGALSIGLVAGATTFVVLELTGVPYPLALAVLVAVTDLVPVVGATVGAAVVCLVGLLHSIPVGIGLAVYYLVYQQLENFLLYPRIMKRSVDVSPVATVVAILIGGALMGVIGALLAIPIAAAVQLVFQEVLVPRQDAS